MSYRAAFARVPASGFSATQPPVWITSLYGHTGEPLHTDFASPLYAVLSNVSSADIVLNEHLTCHGAECRVETPDIINVSLSNGRSFMNIFARLVSNLPSTKMVRPCTRSWTMTSICVRPTVAKWGASCCSGYQQEGLGMCEYFGEVLPFHAAKQPAMLLPPRGTSRPLQGEDELALHAATPRSSLGDLLPGSSAGPPTGWVNLVHSPTTISHHRQQESVPCSLAQGLPRPRLVWHVRNAR